MDYYTHYSDGTTDTHHVCDKCDERLSVFFRNDECHVKGKVWQTVQSHDQMCRPCWSKVLEKYYKGLEG